MTELPGYDVWLEQPYDHQAELADAIDRERDEEWEEDEGDEDEDY